MDHHSAAAEQAARFYFTLTEIDTLARRPPTCSSLFQGPFQPARRDFGISEIQVGKDLIPVTRKDILIQPFHALVQMRLNIRRDVPQVLVVPPLSGHLPFVMRDLIAGMLPQNDVSVLDWINARHIAVRHGNFGFDDNVGCIVDALKTFDPDTSVLALCQGGVPALAATALLAEESAAPPALILISAPVDPLANPTRVVDMLREHSMCWFNSNVIRPVRQPGAGAGRNVYPARIQLTGLMAYLDRHLTERGELFRKLTRDDGWDPERFPFFDLYTSLMDLPDAVFLENIRLVFQERAIARGTLWIGTRRVDCNAITSTALMTIEGDQDDIAAPGQTEAAQGLCENIPDTRRNHLLVGECGHFSTFYGETVRNRIAPAINAFLQGV